MVSTLSSSSSSSASITVFGTRRDLAGGASESDPALGVADDRVRDVARLLRLSGDSVSSSLRVSSYPDLHTPATLTRRR